MLSGIKPHFENGDLSKDVLLFKDENSNKIPLISQFKTLRESGWPWNMLPGAQSLSRL